jgi:hypothetical protein
MSAFSADFGGEFNSIGDDAAPDDGSGTVVVVDPSQTGDTPVVNTTGQPDQTNVTPTSDSPIVSAPPPPTITDNLKSFFTVLTNPFVLTGILLFGGFIAWKMTQAAAPAIGHLAEHSLPLLAA